MALQFDRNRAGRLFTRWPIVSSLGELDKGPRFFLYFIAFNVISWQCVVGTTMMLFGRKIGMPESWVGFLSSFLPLSTLLVLLTGLLVSRFGPKRVMMIAWMLRNLVACLVFTMPLAISAYGLRSAWYVLMASTLGFCLMRAIGGGGWMPWLHEIVPEKQRGSYFSAEAAVSNLLNIIVTFAQGLVLGGNPGVGRFLVVYGIGIASGFASLLWMHRIPGGGSQINTLRAGGGAYRSHRAALSDRAFMVFVAFAALCQSGLAWWGFASILYMRDALRISPEHILYYTAAGSGAVMLSIRYWGRYADHAGSPHGMAMSLFAAACMSIAYLFLRPGMAHLHVALAAVVIPGAVFFAAFWITSNRAMLGYIEPEDRIGYANLWTVVTGMSVAMPPILAGQIIHRLGLWGYRVCFLIGAGICLSCAIGALYVVRKEREFEFPWRQCPLYELPFRFVYSVARISVGLHESNRPEWKRGSGL